MSPTATLIRPAGAISAIEAYSRAEFCRRVGMTRSSFASARNTGLRVIQVGKKLHVLGSDWISFLRQKRDEPQPAKGGSPRVLQRRPHDTACTR